MNILDAEDMIKGLPDQTLMQQAQMPTGELPQFLVISEIQRRSDMRKRHEAQMQEQPQGTVKDQIMREGIAAMMPQQPMGMPPQMMPQGMPPQGGPQMPPQGMPPQGMPPMGMASGGIVRMQGGGFLDQYVAGAEAGPMPGGSTIRDQLDRLLESGMSYPEILSFVSKTFYGRPEALEYVQSKVGRPQVSMGDSMAPAAREMLEREPYESKEARMPMLAGGSDIYKAPLVLRAADALGMFDSFKQGTDPERMAEPAASALARQVEEQYATPDLSQRLTADMLTGAGPVPSRVPEGLPQAPQAPRSGGIGRLFGFLNQKGSDYGPFPPGETVGESPFSRLVAEEGPYARQLYDRLDSVEDLTLYGMLTSDDKGTGGAEVQGAGSNVQARGKSAPDITGLGAYQDELLGYRGDFPYRPGRTPDDMERIQALIAANDRRSEELLGAPAVDGPKPGVESADPVSTLLSAASSVQTDSSDPQNRRRSMIDDPVLDLSDIIAQSERMAKANALMQLGAGIAEGSVAKGISAAGIAATKGMQDARSLEMKKRLAEYQAGREDIRRGEEADRFERQMTLQERKVDISESQFDRTLAQASDKIQADIDKGVRVNKGQLLNYIADVLKEAGRDLIPQAGQTRQEMLTALQNQLLSQFGPFLDVDVSELVSSGAGGGGQPDFSGFSIRN